MVAVLSSTYLYDLLKITENGEGHGVYVTFLPFKFCLCCTKQFWICL